jgi:RNA polymerase sigma-70 factor (ECF subfamily)
MPDTRGTVALQVAEVRSARDEDTDAWFARLYADNWDAILSYALRRTPVREDAADLVAETFLVAWRRAADVPAGPKARPWLYGVARRLLANQRRGARRRGRLVERLREDLAAAVQDEPPPSDEAVVMEALAGLKEVDREVLMLAGWEQLEPAEIAIALEISAVAARSRLHRARRRFRAVFESLEPALPTPRQEGEEE